MDSKTNWLVYLLRCSDNSLYCGITNNMPKRLKSHQDGIASSYTRSRRPVDLILASGPMPKKDAMRLEIRIKQLRKEMKITQLKKWDLRHQKKQDPIDRELSEREIEPDHCT